MSDRAPSDCLLRSWMLRNIHEQKECARLRDTIHEWKQQDPRSVYTLRRDADLQLRTGKFRTLI